MNIVIKNLRFYNDKFFSYELYKENDELLVKYEFLEETGERLSSPKELTEKAMNNIVIQFFNYNNARAEYLKKMITICGAMSIKLPTAFHFINEFVKLLNFAYKGIDAVEDAGKECNFILWIFDKEKKTLLVPSLHEVPHLEENFLTISKLNKENIIIWHNICMEELRALGRNVSFYVES